MSGGVSHALIFGCYEYLDANTLVVEGNSSSFYNNHALRHNERLVLYQHKFPQ